uniref:Sterile alpha motif domain-containing protein 9-like n=1 Tax=Callorhinchus milii TaxID=7868 RepID=A0A4W3JJR6_CALMI
MSKACDFPDNMNEWTKDHVRHWVVDQLKLDQKCGEILYNEDVSGVVLVELTKTDLKEMGLKAGPASLIVRKCNEFKHAESTETSSLKSSKKKETETKGQQKPQDTFSTVTNIQPKTATPQRKGQQFKITAEEQIPKQMCEPHPFDESHTGRRYVQNIILPPETGPSNLMDPIHEYKLLTRTENATEEDIKKKFGNEVFRFAAACMNTRTNGTIHFGVGDTKCEYEHGEIIGVCVDSKDKYVDYLQNNFVHYFGRDDITDAKYIIRPPRFVEIRNADQTLSGKYVIEVDVVPSYNTCALKLYHIHMMNLIDKKWMKSKEKHLFIRDGSSSRDILGNKNLTEREAEYRRFLTETLPTLAEKRKVEEEKTDKKRTTIKQDGHKLSRMITGGADMIDTSYYQRYILVTNKCQENQMQNFDFLKEIDWFAVLEFDPESVTNGVCKSYRAERAANLHFPTHFQDIDVAITEKIERLNLYKQTSWIFCNGRSDLQDETYQPLPPKLWYKERAADIRKLVSFLCRQDIMPKGKYLVVFLLLSKVDDPRDPILETFCSFYQELKGTEDIMCICESEQTFQQWKDLLQSTCDSRELSDRCVSSLTLDEINATILKLKSVTRSTRRFLPSATSASVILQKKEEEYMTALEILCENECEGTEIENDQNNFKEFQKSKEEQFYRGDKASCYTKLNELINSESPSAMCVKIINLFHHPGCGGTTLAMHVLWELRKKVRCAVLRNSNGDFAEIGRQVINLVTYGGTPQSDYLPVLLLVDDFEELENVHMLQNSIQSTVAEKGLRFERPLVIVLNCMRSQDPDRKQHLFSSKLKEIEEYHTRPEDFYSFMIMKTNFDKSYIANLVHNILKDLRNSTKQADLISFLALLNSYVKDSSMSLSKCEEFLGVGHVKTSFWGPEKFEDLMGTYCTLLIRIEVEEYGRYQGIRIIHPLIAMRCLEELKLSCSLHKSEIAERFLSQNMLFQSSIGRDKLLQDTWSMLITRQRKEHGDETDTLFSPLIEAIQKEEGNPQVQSVLTEALNRFDQNPYICQVLARHLCLKEKNFDLALEWAHKAKDKAKDNSYITDTLGQVFKSKLKHRMESEDILKQTVLTTCQLNEFLELAQSASKAFKESQELTEKKGEGRIQWAEQRTKRKHDVYNTSGYLGEIEMALCVIDILRMIPFFNGKDELSKQQMAHLLSGNMNLSHIEKTNSIDEDLCSVLEDYNCYLINIQTSLKAAFDFFEDYFVYFKPRNIEKEIADFKIRKKVSECFGKYTDIFCPSQSTYMAAKKDKPKLSMQLELEDCKKFLEAHKADRFAGLLEFLTNNHGAGRTLEEVVSKYQFVLQNARNKKLTREKQNFILANIVLNCITHGSKKIESYEKLLHLLKEVLQDVGSDHCHAEPYFLASLLFWPNKDFKLNEDSKLLLKYVTSMRRSFRGRYGRMSHSKHAVAHFYLSNRAGLNKLVHKGKIDQLFSENTHRNSLWQSGEIWKKDKIKELLLRVYGRTGEDDMVYVEYGDDERIKVPVRPVYLGKLRSGRSIEKISFYLGFSMDGPIAYDVENIN